MLISGTVQNGDSTSFKGLKFTNISRCTNANFGLKTNIESAVLRILTNNSDKLPDGSAGTQMKLRRGNEHSIPKQ